MPESADYADTRSNLKPSRVRVPLESKSGMLLLVTVWVVGSATPACALSGLPSGESGMFQVMHFGHVFSLPVTELDFQALWDIAAGIANRLHSLKS